MEFKIILENVNEWAEYELVKPQVGMQVLAFSPSYFHPDFNPDAIRIGFRDFYGDFYSAKIENCSPGYETGSAKPTHWKLLNKSFTENQLSLFAQSNNSDDLEETCYAGLVVEKTDPRIPKTGEYTCTTEFTNQFQYCYKLGSTIQVLRHSPVNDSMWCKVDDGHGQPEFLMDVDDLLNHFTPTEMLGH